MTMQLDVAGHLVLELRGAERRSRSAKARHHRREELERHAPRRRRADRNRRGARGSRLGRATAAPPCPTRRGACSSSRESSRSGSRTASSGGAGTWALVPPEVVHAFEVTGDEPARFLDFHVPSSRIRRLRPRLGARRGRAAGGRPLSTSGPRRSTRRAIPGSSSSGATGGRKARRSPTGQSRRATILLDADELTVTEFFPGPVSVERRRTSITAMPTRSSSSRES